MAGYQLDSMIVPRVYHLSGSRLSFFRYYIKKVLITVYYGVLCSLAHKLLNKGLSGEERIFACSNAIIEELDAMKIEEPKQLPADLHIPCYACEKQPATHVCKYQVGELAVQVCLCRECMKIDTQCLLKNTIGLQECGDFQCEALSMV